MNKLRVLWDFNRQQFWVTGLGFDFYLYQTVDFEAESETERYFLECDKVIRDNSDVAV